MCPWGRHFTLDASGLKKSEFDLMQNEEQAAQQPVSQNTARRHQDAWHAFLHR